MNEDSLKNFSEDELAAQAAELERQPLFAALRKLRPSTGELDLYALGFAAGQQAAMQAESLTGSQVDSQAEQQVITSPAKQPINGWSPARAATWSSLASIAATVLVMLTLNSRLTSSTGSDITASGASSEQPAQQPAQQVTQQTVSPANPNDKPPVQQPRPSTQSPSIQSPSTPMQMAQADLLDQWLAELAKRWRDSGALANNQSWADDANSDTEATELPATDQPQLSNRNQRKQWLTSLAQNDSPNTSN